MIPDKAQELGRLIGQSEEYKILKRARERVEAAPELNEHLRRLEQLAQTFERSMQEGVEPSEGEAGDYERLLGQIQADARYQGLVAAQSNFDKLMVRVNQQIWEGLKKGSASPIITLS